MLPFDKRPWAKQLAASVIVFTLIAAVCVPIYLHQHKALDLPIIVGIVLLLLAIIPPNIVILRRRAPPFLAARDERDARSRVHRAAIAAASPAGPPPQTNTSVSSIALLRYCRSIFLEAM